MLSAENVAAAVLLLGLIVYAVFGGADFGGGIWTALASGPRAREQRASLLEAIGPVWETNHIWLILVVVVLFTAFPAAFAALFTALLVPLVLALVGITFRGAAFAFRHFGEQTHRHLPATIQVFSVSSLLTPLVLGMAVAAPAAGEIDLTQDAASAGLFSYWVTPFTLVAGLIGVAICAFITPVFMATRTRGALQEDFRRRALIAAVLLGALTTAAIPVAYWDTPDFADALTGRKTLVVIAAAALCGAGTLWLLWTRRYLAAQVAAGATVAATLAGFGAALYPDLILGQLSIAAAAAPDATLTAFLTALPFGAAVLVPSLAFLYWTFRGNPDTEQPAEGAGAQPGRFTEPS